MTSSTPSILTDEANIDDGSQAAGDTVDPTLEEPTVTDPFARSVHVRQS